MLDETFYSYAVDKQDFLATEELWKKTTALIPDESILSRQCFSEAFLKSMSELRITIEDILQSKDFLDTSAKRWNKLKMELGDATQKKWLT